MDNANFSYLVVFRSQELNSEGPIALSPTGNGTMHLFDEEMYPTLDALEFLLHMPRNIFDVHDIDEKLMNASHDTSHDIIIAPDKLLKKIPNINVTMVILTDDCSEDVKLGCKRFAPPLGIYYSKDWLLDWILGINCPIIWSSWKGDRFFSPSITANTIGRLIL